MGLVWTFVFFFILPFFLFLFSLSSVGWMKEVKWDGQEKTCRLNLATTWLGVLAQRSHGDWGIVCNWHTMGQMAALGLGEGVLGCLIFSLSLCAFAFLP